MASYIDQTATDGAPQIRLDGDAAVCTLIVSGESLRMPGGGLTSETPRSGGRQIVSSCGAAVKTRIRDYCRSVRAFLLTALLSICLVLPFAAGADETNADALTDESIVPEVDIPVLAPPPRPHERIDAKLIAGGRAAGMSFANHGADLAAGPGMKASMARAVGSADAGRFAPFATVSGTYRSAGRSFRTDAGGASAVLGAACLAAPVQVPLMGAAFLEFGAARTSARLRISSRYDRNRFHGKGMARYAGIGLMARTNLAEARLGGPYAEASFRAGVMNSDWNSKDMFVALNGKQMRYSISTPYYGAHLGLGYVWMPADAWSVDFYAKYFWTRLEGGHTKIADDPYRFKAMDSHRLCAGARAEIKISEQTAVYAGAAIEREFRGEVRATVYGFDMPSPSSKGNTGILDLGIYFKPAPMPALKLEIGGSAFIGKRRGVSGSVMAEFEF